MSNLEALLLGVVQGLTEFLPISSSGHLIIVPWLQDYTFLLENPHFNKTFDVALHAGTLIAAIAYFRREVVLLIRGFIEAVRQRAIETADERLSVAIAIGTVPAVIAGGLGSDFIDEHLGEPWMIAMQLIVFGALLGWADRLPQRKSLEQSDGQGRLVHRPRPGTRAGAGHLALGDHDHRRPLPRPRPRQRRPFLVSAADSGRCRRHPLQGRERGPRRPALRRRRADDRRHPRRRGLRLLGDRLPAAPGAHDLLRAVRLLPLRGRRRDPADHRHRPPPRTF